MKIVRVTLKNRSYPIYIGDSLLLRAGELLKGVGLVKKHLLIVSQKQVAAHYEKKLRESLLLEGFESSVFLTPASKSSEASKTQAVWSRLIRELARHDGKNRALAVLALGGGVIGDLAGFASAVYRRGIPCVQIPTTLTAQVDSSIGGKTGIDLPEGKNLLGTIYQPIAVLADTSVLDSLPKRQWSDGFAEVIKYGVIKDPSLFRLLETKGIEGIRREPGCLEKVITRCAEIKAEVVASDEFDKTGQRIILNFGHTAGHAIEAASGYSAHYTHGEAVAVGMLIACDISEKMKVLKDRELCARLEKALIKFTLPVYTKAISVDAILKAIGYDKKSLNQANRFVLPVQLGRVTVVNSIPNSVIVEALEKRRR
jgi:3-dehydroquinate synthase